MSKKSNTSQAERKHRQQKIKESIVMLNDVVKLRIAPSEVHGVGVFAMRDIKKGERIYANAITQLVDVPHKKFHLLRPEIRDMILEHFPLVVEGSHFMCPDTLMQMYMNHDGKPNYDNKTDKALKKIKKGEEVFEDYKQIEGWEKVHTWLKE